MATRQDRERATKLNERHQAILAEMLNDDANKYCADCRSKGPRWASWNIGVFVCIRCAGIHRNLGVHISKMKSVNLDTWAAEQIECIRTKGNGPVNAMYEHNLPENFRRPTDDSAVEVFIRSKYERKQYYKKADKSEKLSAATSNSSNRSDRAPKKDVKKKSSAHQVPKVSKTSVSAVPRPSSSNHTSRTSSATPTTPAKSPTPARAAAPAQDLLGDLSAPAPAAQPTSSAQSAGSDMGAFMGASSSPNPNADMFGSAAPAPVHQTDLFQGASMPQPMAAPQANKDSILSLYGGQQQQQQQQMGGFAGAGMAGGMQGGMAGAHGMSAGQMAYQQQMMMQQQMQQQMYMQQQLAAQQQQLVMQQQALQVNQVQDQMSRLRMGSPSQNGQMAGGWAQQPQAQQPGQTMNNSLWH